jgi:hypothetical protein
MNRKISRKLALQSITQTVSVFFLSLHQFLEVLLGFHRENISHPKEIVNSDFTVI